LRFGIAPRDKDKSKDSKAIQLLAEMIAEFAEENGNTIEQATRAARRAADLLREKSKKASK
jgi:hypothetical protein